MKNNKITSIFFSIFFLIQGFQVEAQFRARSSEGTGGGGVECYTSVTLNENGDLLGLNTHFKVSIQAAPGNLLPTFTLEIKAFDQDGFPILISDEDESPGISILKGPNTYYAPYTDVQVDGNLHPIKDITNVCYHVTIVGQLDEPAIYCSDICLTNTEIELPTDEELSPGLNFENPNSTALNAFPNPVELGQTMTISMGEIESGEFTLFDVDGKALASYFVNENTDLILHLDQAGTYFLVSKNPYVKTIKLIAIE